MSEFHYDKQKADDAIYFISNLKLTKGRWAGQPFKLLDWQKEEVLKPLFGMVDKNGMRQYRVCFVFIPKKNGKTPLGAAIGLYLFFADGENGAEVYSAAADRDQASIVFNVASKMVQTNTTLLNNSKIIDSQKRFVRHKTNSVYRALSSEVHTKHGYNPSGVIFDELHAQQNRELWDVLTIGTGAAREQQLIFVITTAGFDRNSICWEQYEYAMKVKKGVIKDEQFLPIIYGVDMEADWEDETEWKKANPSLGKILKLSDIRKEYKKAKETPSLQNKFRRLRLNQWTRSEIRWLSLDKWDRCKGDFIRNDLKGRLCFGGLDLASCIDIAAEALIFPPIDENEKYKILMRFWIPEDNIEARIKKDNVPYDVWIDKGYISATPGNVINYKYIINDIKEDMEFFDLKEMAFDRWGATKIVQELQELGFDKPEENKYAEKRLIQFGQGYKSMSPPTKEFEKLIISQNIKHNGNPVLRWMIDNVVIRMDPAGGIKPDKGKSTEKIDGVVASIMGLDRALKCETFRSVYEDRGVLVF